jgi:precorrin-2/cobalt-factor-2 C20-methyltransferase
MTVAASGTTGRLFGVGVGPGDPELLTVKATRVLAGCAVIAHFAARRRQGNAWTTVQTFVRPDQTVLRLEYPLTTEATDRDEYERCIAGFYDCAAQDIAAHLDAGSAVAVVCEGDPFFYGSFMYLHNRLSEQYDTEIVPGVASFLAGAAVLGAPLVCGTEVFTTLSGGLGEDELVARLLGGDAVVVMKLGRNLDKVRRAVERAGLLERAWYVERATMANEHVVPLAGADAERAPYFSMVVVPSATATAR